MYNYPEIFESICYNDIDHAIMKAINHHVQSLPSMQPKFIDGKGIYAEQNWRIRVEKSYHDESDIYPPNYVYDIGQGFYDEAGSFKANCKQKGLVLKALCCETYPTITGLVQESSLLTIYYDIDSSIIDFVKKTHMENVLEKIACAFDYTSPDHSFVITKMTTQGPSS